MTRLSDAEARRAIAHDLDATLVVEAAAGTGKTTELVTRILRVLVTGRATMDSIVAVTFTEKAAGELKLRVREALERARADAAEIAVRQNLEAALRSLEEAHVNTIHGFCADLLRERPVEARVDPLFRVLTEPDADRLYARAFQDWMQAALADPPEGVRRALRRSSGYGDEADGPIGRLQRAGRLLAEWREFPAPWARLPWDRDAGIERLIAQLHHLAGLTEGAKESDNLFADLAALRRLSRQVQLEQSFGPGDLDAWEARLVDLSHDRALTNARKGSGASFGRVPRSDALAAREAFVVALRLFVTRADADLAALLQQELAGATARYTALKAHAGALDFNDLLARTRELLRRDRAVRRHLQSRFSRIFVDEFQDTDPVQADILMLLASADDEVDDPSHVRPVPGKLFIVGDPKQAIYRFRGTDVGTYWRVCRQLEDGGGRVLQLTKSYRSVPEIQRFVNRAFGGEMVRDEVALQAEYVPLAEHRLSYASQPAIVALPVPAPYAARGTAKLSARAIDESLPSAVGAFLDWLLSDSGWTVCERDAADAERRVGVAPRHVAVLFRRFVSWRRDVTRDYIDAIEARGIPHLLVGGKAFHGREEVETVRAALSAIEWPDDELSVFATLRGALFAFDDEVLGEFRQRFGRWHPFRIPAPLGGNGGTMPVDPAAAHLAPVTDALRVLQRLTRDRNSRPVADTIARLLSATRAHVGFMLRPAGEQALANVMHVAELARRYEADGGISFRGFIEELRVEAERLGAPEAPIVEEGSDGVRLMTVHKAKGLEFPVVVLADLTCRISRDDPGRFLDPSRGLCAMKIGGWAPQDLHDHAAEEIARDRAEGTRLAYVAATRARDLLVVPAVGDQPFDGGWFDPLNRALYPPMASRRAPLSASGCPTFKSRDSVLSRPTGDPASPQTVAPGRHSLADDQYDVVWWDPHVLALDATPPFGVRREELIVKDVDRHIIEEGRQRYLRWRDGREAARATGSSPSIVVETVRARSAREAAWTDADAAARVAVVSVRDAHTALSSGPAFGALVHAILADVPLDAGRATIAEVAVRHGRVLASSPAHVSDASVAVERVLGHNLFDRVRAAAARGACRRESPVMMTAPDGALVEGVVDLAFLDGDRWTVVDFKTDRRVDAGDDLPYRRQVALYAAAVAAATGQPADAILVHV